MNHRIGRAAEREQHAERILDRFLIDELRWRELRADELDRGDAGCLGRAEAIGMNGGDRGGPRQT